jgi:Lipid A 3-O-deacylase (PagL)
LVVSLIPLLVIGSQDKRFTLDMGAGGAVLSRHHFGTQDFGGYFQFALTAGVGVPLYKRVGVGYRFLHYSDGGSTDLRTRGQICTCWSSPTGFEGRVASSLPLKRNDYVEHCPCVFPLRRRGMLAITL